MRNYSLDSLKFILCFLVIWIHSALDFEEYPFAEYIMLIARIAVPLFLLISGFYYPILVKKDKVGGYFRKIVHLTVLATFLYMLTMPNLVIHMHWKGFAIWGLFNATPFGMHLWYLFSLIYVLIIFKIFPKIVFSKYGIWISIILIMCNYALSFQPDYVRYRNFLFTGIPYMLLGVFIQQHKESILNWKLTKTQSWGILIAMLSLLILEYHIYDSLQLQLIRDHYFMIYPLCFFIFISALRFPKFSGYGVLSFFGQKYSTYIYVFHCMMIKLVDSLMSIMKEGGILTSTQHNYIYPFIILILTISFIYTYYKIKKLFCKNI